MHIQPGGLSPPNIAFKRRRTDVSQGLLPDDTPRHPPALTAFYQGTPIAAGPSLVGKSLTGRVDAKFDFGYFVSVNVDNHAFQGIRHMTGMLNLIMSQPCMLCKFHHYSLGEHTLCVAAADTRAKGFEPEIDLVTGSCPNLPHKAEHDLQKLQLQ